MNQRLQPALELARDLPVADLPRLLGDLEEVRATALARLTAPQPIPAQSDELVDVQTAAVRLGVGKDYLYHHAYEMPFARRQGRKLLFSSAGIDRHIKTNRA